MIPIFLKWHIIDLGARVQLASFCKTWLLEVSPVYLMLGSCQASHAWTPCSPWLCTDCGNIAGCPHKSPLSEITAECVCSEFLFSQHLARASQHSAEPGDPEAPHSAIPPNALLQHKGKTLLKEDLVKSWLRPVTLAK